MVSLVKNPFLVGGTNIVEGGDISLVLQATIVDENDEPVMVMDGDGELVPALLATDLVVNIRVSQHGNFYDDDADMMETIEADSNLSAVSISTNNDNLEEPDGFIKVALVDSDNYMTDIEYSTIRVGVIDNDASGETHLPVFSVTPPTDILNNLPVLPGGSVEEGDADEDGNLLPVRFELGRSGSTDNSSLNSEVSVMFRIIEQGMFVGTIRTVSEDPFAEPPYDVLTADASGNISSTDSDVHRARLALEANRIWASSWLSRVEIGGRVDSGDTEDGIDIAGELSTNYHDYINFSAGGHWLLAHSESDFEEWSVNVSLNLQQDPLGYGTRFSLTPGLGTTTHGNQAGNFWADRSAFQPLAINQQLKNHLDVNMSYGMGLGNVLLSPYGEISLHDQQKWRLGMRLEMFGELSERMSLELFSEHSDYYDSGRQADYDIGLEGSLNF